MILVKPGVVFTQLRKEIYSILPILDSVFEEEGLNCVITSAEDGKHMRWSKHDEGLALDLRVFHMTKDQRHLVVDSLRNLLNRPRHMYDIVLEKDHIHIEHDPRNP